MIVKALVDDLVVAVPAHELPGPGAHRVHVLALNGGRAHEVRKRAGEEREQRAVGRRKLDDQRVALDPGSRHLAVGGRVRARHVGIGHAVEVPLGGRRVEDRAVVALHPARPHVEGVGLAVLADGNALRQSAHDVRIGVHVHEVAKDLGHGLQRDGGRDPVGVHAVRVRRARDHDRVCGSERRIACEQRARKPKGASPQAPRW